MKPTDKSPQIDTLLTTVFGVHRKESIYTGNCVMCEQLATKFRDSISKREFSISGMCQTCQDKIFG